MLFFLLLPVIQFVFFLIVFTLILFFVFWRSYYAGYLTVSDSLNLTDIFFTLYVCKIFSQVIEPVAYAKTVIEPVC